MASNIELANALAVWAGCNEARLAELESWQSNALAAMAAGKGKDVVSTSANGVSVTFSAGSTNADWFAITTRAIAIVANGLPAKRKQAIFTL